MGQIKLFVQGPDGQSGDLLVDAPTRGAALQHAQQQGFNVLGVGEAVPTPAPAPAAPAGPNPVVRFAGEFPKLIGGARMGQVGAQLGRPFGHVAQGVGGVLGTVLGAAGTEGAYAGLQKLFGVPTGDVGQRVTAAPRQALEAEVGGKMIGGAARGVGRGIGAVGRFFGPKVAAGTGEAAGDALAAGLREEAGKVGSIDKTEFARRVRGPLRQLLRSTQREFMVGQYGAPKVVSRSASETAADPMVKTLRGLVERDISLAPIADAAAKDPQMLATLLHQAGRPDLLPQLQSAWLTSTSVLPAERAAQSWADLGAEGQQALFGERAPALAQLFETSQRVAPALAGSASKLNGQFSPMIKVGAALMLAEGLYRHLPGANVLAAGLLLTKTLQNPGVAEALTQVGEYAANPAAFAQVSSQLGRALVAAVTAGTQQQQAPRPAPQAPQAPQVDLAAGP